MDHQRPSSRLDFEVAIICALPLEFDAIALLFDHLWDEDGDQYGRAVGDPNHYTTGRFGKYNIVLALLTHTDRATAASTAASMRTSYPRLRLALFVGICSGVPHVVNGDDEYELMLGDVVISNTVVQYDFDMQRPGSFIHKNTVESNSIRPNKDIRNLLATFKTDFCMDRLRKKTINYLRKLQASAPVKTRGKYMHPGTLEDKLFEPTYLHKHQASAACCGGSEQTSIYICEKAICSSCEDLGCDEKYLVARHQLATNRLPSQIGGEEPSIHIGAVASGDTAMKSGGDRDHIAKNEGIIAFEMGGAGVWEEVPCIIVKGVCDYADSHQNKKWQVFAAATAASASKAILERYIQTEKEIVTFNPSERDTGLLRKNQILQSSVTQLRTELRIILQSHLQVPRSMTIDYIMVIDALNRPLRFFLETIRSKKLFIEILKEAFDGIGSKKIEKEDWFLEDGDNGQVLDLKRPWMSLMKPGRILHMGMIFHRRGIVSTQCPTCHAENEGDPTEQVTWQVSPKRLSHT
ncbi:nucleoside phosphorylase domain-containing protein [Trichoderma chlorosporum]